MNTPVPDKVKALPITQAIDTLEFLHSPGTVFEVCAIGLKAPTSKLWTGRAYGKKLLAAGWFKDPTAAAKLMVQVEAETTYCTLNPCQDAMLGRADHRLKANVDRTADQHIASIKNLLVDIDAIRPAGVSSTDAEHDAALQMVKVIKADLTSEGLPDPLVGDSGNGAHLVYPLDLPNDQESVALVKAVLEALAQRYAEELNRLNLEIDLVVFNPARLTKLFGTWTRKGDSTQDRPHRMAKIISLPEIRRPVPVELLKKLVATTAPAAASQAKEPEPEGRFDPEAYLAHYRVEVVKVKPHGGGMLYCLQECFFDPSHNGNEAAIGQAQDGILFYQCFHSSCKGRTWAEARAKISGADKLDRFMVGGGSRTTPAPKPPAPDYDQAERAAIREEGQAKPQGGASKTAAQVNVIADLNRKHAVVMLGGKCVVMNETVEPIFNRPDINFSSTADFKTCYSNRTIEVPTKRGTALEPLAKVWLESPLRRQHEGIVFAPGQDIPGFYNLYRGLAVDPVKGDCSLYWNHVRDVICAGNEEIFRYIKAWMAHLVQDPGGERSGTSVVMRGRQGTGKGCFASQFGEIFGSHFLHITNPTHLVHRFNQHLKDALLVFVDEGIWAGDKTAEGILKGMITEKYFMCEPKGKDAFPVKNHVHLIIASNSQWVVPAGLEERRFMVLDVSDKYIQDKDYFKAIFYQMDHGGREAMLCDLLETDLSGVDLRTIPRTGALLDQMVHTMSTAHKFWFERLRAGTLIDEHREWESYVITEKLYDAYLKFSENCGERYRLIDRQFGKELRRLCPDVKRGHRTIDSREKWVLYVPELETCREQFENIVKVKVNWKADVNENDLPF